MVLGGRRMFLFYGSVPVHADSKKTAMGHRSSHDCIGCFGRNFVANRLDESKHRVFLSRGLLFLEDFFWP